jgi:hypothetical protein
MIKKSSIFYIIYILIFWSIYSSSYSQSVKSTPSSAQKKIDNLSKEVADSTLSSNFDSLLVIHFHPTAQCSCCINVGNFSKKGLEKFYSKPYKNGHIIFKECNIDEDSSTAKRYKIFGSALGFRKQIKGKEEFKEIESVWEFCEDEEKFLIDFREELDRFIRGGKSEIKKTAE